MMKRLSVLVLLLSCASFLHAQSNAAYFSNNDPTPQNAAPLARPQLSDEPLKFSGRSADNGDQNPPPPGVSAIDVQLLGTASNAFTIINNRTNQIATVDYENDENDIIAFIHRQNINIFGGAQPTTANGVLRVDYRTGLCPGDAGDGGWKKDIGPLNPTPYDNASRIRYPQAVLHLPEGESPDDFDNYHYIWHAPTTDGNGWGNYCRGVAWDLCTMTDGQTQEDQGNINFGFLSNDQNNEVIIPGGLCEGRSGEFWFLDNKYTPTGPSLGIYQDSVYLYRGVMNGDNEEVEWARHRAFKVDAFIERDYNPGDPESNKYYFSSAANMAFSPDGMHGWAMVAADLNEDPGQDTSYSAQPVLWHTHDGGDTWEGPMELDLREYSTITDSIFALFLTEEGDTNSTTGIPFMINAADITVDGQGNPHILTTIANQADENPHPDSTRFFQMLGACLFDITTYDQGRTWYPKFISRATKYLGTLPGTAQNFGNYMQISRDPAGEHIFYSWIDDTVSDGTQNMRPNLFGAALSVEDEFMTDVRSLTLDDPTFNGSMFYPQVAPIVLTRSDGTFELPTIFMQLRTTELEEVGFLYINERVRTPEEFMAPENDVALRVNSPEQQICFGSSVQFDFELTNEGEMPVMDSIVVRYRLGDGPWTREVVDLEGSPLEPGASISYQFTEMVDISESGSYDFVVEAISFDDQAGENNKYVYTVENIGGEDQELFSETTIQGCGQAVLNTGLPNNATTWFNADGEEIGSDASITIEESGAYTVSVVTDGCDVELLEDEIEVVINESPPIDTVDYFSACAEDGLNLTINDGGDQYDYTWTDAPETGEPEVLAETNEFSPTESGFYIATVRDRNTGCENSLRKEARLWEVTVDLAATTFSDPAVNDSNGYVMQDDGSWHVCEAVRLNAANETHGPGVSYTWFYDGEEQPDATGAGYITVIDPAADPHLYRVVATDPLGCNADDPAEDEIEVVTWATELQDAGPDDPVLISQFLIDFPVDEIGTSRLPAGECINLMSTSIAGPTPITCWEFATFGGTPVDGASEPNEFGNCNPDRGPIDTSSYVVTFEYNRRQIPGGEQERRIELRTYSGTCSDTMVIDFVVATDPPYEPRDYSVFGEQGYPDGPCAHDDLVGAKELNPAAVQLNVYPNPSNGEFNFDLQLESAENVTLEVYDINGRRLYRDARENVTQVNDQIDLGNAAAGVYILKVETSESISTQRIVKY